MTNQGVRTGFFAGLAVPFLHHGGDPFQVRPMFLISFPLMIIPFAAYNFFVVAGEADSGGNLWNETVFDLPTSSELTFHVTLGQVLIAATLFLMVVETLKARCVEVSTVADHILSLAVLLAYGLEFYFLERAATPTFFLLGLIALASLAAGIALSRGRSARVRIG